MGIKRIVKIIIAACAVIAITLIMLGITISTPAITVTGLGFLIVTIISIIVYVFYSSRKIRGYGKGFESFYQAGDYDGGIKHFEEKLDTLPEGVEKEQSAYYLMTFYFLKNDIDKARDLFGEIEFNKYEEYVLYYDILLDLYDGVVGEAKEKYERFMATKQPDLTIRKLTLKQLFDFVDDKVDTINLESDYPIIKDIVDRYAE